MSAPRSTANPPQAASLAPRLWALLPCAGHGSRAGGGVPKQYRLLAGRPMVLHTLAALQQVTRIDQIVVVVAPDDRTLDPQGEPPPQRWSVANCGGASRAETVTNGLAHLVTMGASDGDWVLVHDAARCLVTPPLVDRLIDACRADPVGGLLAQPLADTLKRARGGRVAETPDRTQHWLAQTPQMFRIGQLQQALRQAGPSATDEASAIEHLGLAPLLVPGSPSNIKLTYAEDFVLAEAVLRARVLEGSS